MKDAPMDTHRLIFPKYTMSTQLGQPDVEDVMALCLEVVEVISSIQVYAFGLLVDRHDSKADIKGAMELPSLNILLCL